MKRTVIHGCLILFLSMGMVGCQSLTKSEPPPSFFHQVGEQRLDSLNLEGTFRMAKFKQPNNIIAHPLATSQARQVLAAQIRDREPPHLHQNHDLTVFLHRGKGILKTPGDSIPMTSGDWVTIERDLPHQFINGGTKPAQALVIRTPAVDDDTVKLDSLSTDSR